jgi:hypothetical protein
MESLSPFADGPIPEVEAPSTPAPQRFDFEGEIAAYERRERRWAFRKSAANLSLDEHAEAFDRRHARWSRGETLAKASDFRVDGERLDQIINAALNVEVALGRHRALFEHDFANFDLRRLKALREHCRKHDRRVFVGRRVQRAEQYLDLARSDLILDLLLELRGWRKLARKIGWELREQFDRDARITAEINVHGRGGFREWCDDPDESANDNASEHTDEPPAVTSDNGGANVNN